MEDKKTVGKLRLMPKFFYDNIVVTERYNVSAQ